jgi:hypothetical protein
MKQFRDGFVLDSGREFYANNNIIGLGPNLEVSEGHDGGVVCDDWIPQERAELADYMIALWMAFKVKA